MYMLRRGILARKALQSASDIECPPSAACLPLLYLCGCVAFAHYSDILSRRRHHPMFTDADDILYRTFTDRETADPGTVTRLATCARVPEL